MSMPDHSRQPTFDLSLTTKIKITQKLPTMQHLTKAINTIILFAILSANLFAQMHDGTFGNEWIDHSQSYYKIKVLEDGFYHIDKQVLLRDINGMAQIPPQNFQLFYQGQEVPVYVHTVNGQVQYMAFYAEKNKGQLDVNMYRNPAHQLNPEYSLISDTAIYFLTWNAFGMTQQYQNHTSNFNSAPTKETYYMHESKTVISNAWNRGVYRNYGAYVLSNATFEQGEGYGGSFQKLNNITVSTPHIYPSGTSSTARFRAYSNGVANHQIALSIGSQSTTYNTFYGDSVVNIAEEITNSNLTLGSTIVKIEGMQSAADKLSISVVSITYPRSFNFEGKSIFKFKITGGTNKKILEIENFNGGISTTQDVFLYDITNNLRIHCFWNGGKVYAELPPSAHDRDLVLTNQIYKTSINQVQRANFENYTIAQGNYIIITHPSLFTSSVGNNPIFEYAVYRSSTGYTPVIVSIEQLYDQFAYGIYNHPIAIKNFATYIKQAWQNTPPKYLFLIGKARIYTECRTYPAINNLVPTFGFPPSDNLLVAPIGSDVPSIPVGRLAAETGDEVLDYLNKVRLLEKSATDSLSLENQLWRKRTIQLGGGANAWEQSILKSHLLAMETKMENGKFGAQVHSFFKDNDSHVDVPNSKMIDSLVNNGVAMVTFFGHGSVKGFDYYLADAKHYKNKDKYPLVMALGCYNGTIYQQKKLISEEFIFEKEAGASAYVSFVDAVTISAASALSGAFYEHLNGDSYGEGIGTLLQKSLADVTNTANYAFNPVYQMGCQYMVFHGDPAVKINYRNTPDYQVDTTHISTMPEVITQDLNNFKLLVDVHNLGQYLDTTLLISIVRQHPAGTLDTSFITIAAPKDQSQVEIVVPINGHGDFGLNQFSIHVDANNAHTESPAPTAEQNNIVLNYTVWVGNPIITPIFPRNYAIINDTVITLKAMTSNAFETAYTWYVEIDTNKNFNSPFLLTEATVNSSNILTWTPNIVLENEKVYYWRVQAMDANMQMSEWAHSSFVYLAAATTEGWNQSHVQQYQDDDFNKLHLSTNPLFQFNPTMYEISAKAGFIPNGLDDENLAIYQNGSKVDKCRCPSKNGVYVAVLDPNTLELWTMPGGSRQYGALNCDDANRTAYAFLFETNTMAGQRSLSRFVTDSIPDGHLVILYTLNNAFAQSWETDLIQHLRLQGANQIDSVISAPLRSYAIAYKKGYPNHPYFSEEVGLNKTEVASAYTATNKAWYEGKMTSPLIGPAQIWEKLEWNASHLESYGDSVSVDLWAIDHAGMKHLLYSNITTDTLNLTAIDAQQYPYLQLVLNNKDHIHKTAAQLNYWRVYGNMTTDIALAIHHNYIDQYQTTNSQPMIIDLVVLNMGFNTIDTAIVKYTILGTDTLGQGFSTLHPSGSANIQINIPLIGLVGQQVLIGYTEPLQNETILSNNWAWLEFNVVPSQLRVGVDQTNQAIQNLECFPNPFSTQTQIQFELNGDLPQEVCMEIYDTKGVLIFKNTKPADSQNNWTWAGVNQEGIEMPSGMYFVRISSIYTTANDAHNAHNTPVHQIVKLIVAR